MFLQLNKEDANSEGDWSARAEEERRQREEEYDRELREMERIRYEEQQRREVSPWSGRNS